MLGIRNLSSALPFGRKRASLSLKVEPLVLDATHDQWWGWLLMSCMLQFHGPNFVTN